MTRITAENYGDFVGQKVLVGLDIGGNSIFRVLRRFEGGRCVCFVPENREVGAPTEVAYSRAYGGFE